MEISVDLNVLPSVFSVISFLVPAYLAYRFTDSKNVDAQHDFRVVFGSIETIATMAMSIIDVASDNRFGLLTLLPTLVTLGTLTGHFHRVNVGINK